MTGTGTASEGMIGMDTAGQMGTTEVAMSGAMAALRHTTVPQDMTALHEEAMMLATTATMVITTAATSGAMEGRVILGPKPRP
jgi:hypothetical protein